MNLSITYDPSVANAPAAFKSAVDYVVSLFDATFTNKVTININVGWGTIDGTPIDAGALGESETLSATSYSYGAVRAALLATASTSKSATQIQAAASLPVSDPTHGAQIDVGTAQAKALGLQKGGGGAVDGYVGFDSTVAWSFTPGATPSSNAFDLVGTIEHEVTEVMGRYADVSASFETLMDLFRFTASGVRDFTTGGSKSTAYFSLDNGVSNLGTWNNNPNNGDLGDWYPKGPTANGRDSFNDYASPGGLDALSTSDMALLNALGWANGTTSAPVLSLTSAGGTTNVIDHVVAGTIDLADAGDAITLYDNGAAIGGPFTAAADGTFLTAVTFSTDGVHSIAAKTTASSGAVVTSNSVQITLDSSPNAPLFAALTPNLSSPGGEVYALYDALLGRAPDEGGFTNWTNAIGDGAATIDQVTADFLASPEFTSRFGDYTILAPASFVTDLYQDTLHRAPDQAGLANWVNAIQNGVSREQVAADFAFSPEHASRIQGAFQVSGFEPTTTGADVARLYYALLDRAPDAAGLANWDNAIATGSLTLAQVAADFASSLEFTSTHNGGNDAFVTALYAGALGRAPDVSGDATWISALNNGMSRSTVALDFAESPEATNRNAAQVNAFHVA